MPVPMVAHRELLALRCPVFENIEALYAQEGGATSPETDFGVHWALTESGRVAQFQWRVSHIDETGIVYAIALSFTPIVVMIAKGLSRDEAEFALAGWENRATPTLAWAAHQLASWNPVSSADAPLFEEDVSPLTSTNDGRVRITSVADQPGMHGIVVDGTLTWRTRDRVAVDAFIAGWDARDDA